LWCNGVHVAHTVYTVRPVNIVFTAHTVRNVHTVFTVYTVCTVYAVHNVCTVYTVHTLHTVYTVHTLHTVCTVHTLDKIFLCGYKIDTPVNFKQYFITLHINIHNDGLFPFLRQLLLIPTLWISEHIFLPPSLINFAAM